MNIYAGNLPYNVNEDELSELFSQFGEVDSAKIIKDRYTGKSKGFGFVEMPNQSEAEKAIDELNNSDLKGRSIKVNQARERSDRQSRKSDRRYPY